MKNHYVWTAFLIGFISASSTYQMVAAAHSNALFSFEDGNWAGDACTAGGLDAGEVGDMGALVVSGNKDINYPPSLEVKVDLPFDLQGIKDLNLEIGFRCNSMQTPQASIYWDGNFLTHINAYGTGEELKVFALDPLSLSMNLKQGTHSLRITAADTSNQWDYFELDAIRIGPPKKTFLNGGHLIPFEIIPLDDGNWKGDGGTWGGLDEDSSIKSDRAAAIVKSDSNEFPSAFELKTYLDKDFSQSDVLMTIGLRRNHRMTRKGWIYWDGKLLAECSPYMDPGNLDGRDSILAEITVHCNKGEFNFAPGEHIIRLATSPTEVSSTMLQIDSFLLEAIPPPVNSTRIYLDEWHFYAPSVKEGIVKEALNHFQLSARSLGATGFAIDYSLSDMNEHSVYIGTGDNDKEIKQRLFSENNAELLKDLKPFQEHEAYILQLEPSSKILNVGGLQSLGSVHAISDLELRLRTDKGRVYIDFPEGQIAESGFRIFEFPLIEDRGEYMNVGYNHKGITPHEWDQVRWHTYIDLLVLARLNHFYFYIWNDSYTLYPGSVHSKNPLNKKMHENIRDMIEYAHKRGLKVTYMMCPTYFPGDIWSAHPEIHAEIEYVNHGFPAVCPQAPGAWEMMKEISRSEMEWFSGADALQIWFYDPGGCWCRKNGCYDHQAEILARQVKEFSSLFRELNPNASIEYNIWPIWLWEEQLGLKYREEMNQRIKELLGNEFQNATAAGASDNDITLPLMECKMGFRGTAFIFGANPESAYDFLIPHLTYMKETALRVLNSGINGAFGHRLEAWTRYPATFFMGQYLWDPGESKENNVRKYANWITCDNEIGIRFAEAILLLDQFTYEGANPLLGGRMSRLTRKVFDHVPNARKEITEYFPAMMEALAVIGRSVGVEENAALTALAAEFGHALEASTTLQPIANDQKYYFDKYRTFLLRGWRNGAF